MSGQCPSRGPERGGKLCQEIGDKIGRATHSSVAKASPLELPPATAGLSPATM